MPYFLRHLPYFPKVHLVNPAQDEDEIQLEEDTNTEYNDNNDNDDEIA
jgi:hypothetical protein